MLGVAVQDGGDQLAGGEGGGEQPVGVGSGEREVVPMGTARDPVPGDVHDERFVPCSFVQILAVQESPQVCHRGQLIGLSKVEASPVVQVGVGEPAGHGRYLVANPGGELVVLEPVVADGDDYQPTCCRFHSRDSQPAFTRRGIVAAPQSPGRGPRGRAAVVRPR